MSKHPLDFIATHIPGFTPTPLSTRPTTTETLPGSALAAPQHAQPFNPLQEVALALGKPNPTMDDILEYLRNEEKYSILDKVLGLNLKAMIREEIQDHPRAHAPSGPKRQRPETGRR